MIVVVVGPGGVGKGTVVRRLLELDPALRLSRSWTTRARRPGEAEDAYVFVDEDTFRAAVDADAFLEYTYFEPSGSWYGTPRLPQHEEGDVVLEIEVHGAEQVCAAEPDALVVLLLPPSPDELEVRLRARGDDEDHVRRRVAAADAEIARARALHPVEVVNDDVDRAARAIAGMLDRHREQFEREH